MQYPFKTCLTLAEWIEDRRGRARSRRETEKRTILTLLSQGAVGGMFGYFLVIVLSTALYPNNYSFIYFIVLPVFLAFGAFCGAVTGLFVWLPSVRLKRKIGFIPRTLITAGAMSLLSIALSYRMPEEQVSTWWLACFVCAMYLPIVLMTGSGIRPGRVLVFGSSRCSPRRSLRGWLAIPPAVLLRVASIFGLLESSLVLAVWISARMSRWSSASPLEGLPAILLAITYFLTSTYLSLRTPRKIVLLPLAIGLNMPVAFLMVTENQLDTLASDFLAYSYFGFICLWMVYTVGCLIAPTAASPAARLVNGTFTLKGYRNATV
ncbi:MAG: hypothetical protein ABJA18_10090 [bacterium]